MNTIRKVAITSIILTSICLRLGYSFADAADKGAGAASPSGKPSGRLLLTGSSTMAPLMKEIGKRFQSLHAGVQVEVQAGGSGRGINDARLGKADIGMASRALTDKERDLYAFPIARDGVCVIIHMNNRVKALSDSQVADIFTGRTSNWKKVGGPEAPIIVLAAAERYSSTELFTHYFGLKYSDVKAHQTVGDNPTRIRAVVENPRSICYVSIGEAEREARAGAPIKLLPVDGVAATSRNVATSNFPISRPLTLVTKNLPAGLVKEFIEFSLSSQVFDLIPAFDFIPYSD